MKFPEIGRIMFLRKLADPPLACIVTCCGEVPTPKLIEEGLKVFCGSNRGLLGIAAFIDQ